MSSYKILVEKEYLKLKRDKKTPIIGCLMMVKNEEKRIHVSLESVTGTVDCMIIYDTGSTDKTIEIITNHCEKHKLNLYMIQGDFVNFSVSRNISLDYADTKEIDFILLLDTNDELKGGDKLKKLAINELFTSNIIYLVCQHWWSGNMDKYFNTRFMKANSGWRYKGVVHEYLCNTKEGGPPVVKLPDDIILYQDRTLDDNKSGNRFIKDKELLLIEHKINPSEPRTLFYLAQTCSCLNEHENAFYYYKLRSELEGFQEEKFHAYLKCGELSENLKHSWYDSFQYYIKAIEHSHRVEPLIKITHHYIQVNNWVLAYTFIKTACSFIYPSESILFVDKHSYDYLRWHLMGIVAYYTGQYAEGKIACLEAIKNGKNTELDKKNLVFYEKKEAENDIQKNELTKTQFISNEINKLKTQSNHISMKKIEKLALNKWKNRNK